MRAATSMFLTSLANSLPRLASRAAFLCFVVAHLECPAISLLPTLPPSGGRLPPQSKGWSGRTLDEGARRAGFSRARRSEEHTSELQSRGHLVCRLLLEKKKCHTTDLSSYGQPRRGAPR